MDPREVRHVGVVGCGLMGSGIVEVLARAGADVTYVEGTDELVARGRAMIERSVGKAVDRGKLEPSKARRRSVGSAASRTWMGSTGRTW